jgi:hypothetical protein
MPLNQQLLNAIQKELHLIFSGANIRELNRDEFNLPNPNIILDDSEFDPAVDNENLYDALGYFNDKTSDSIHLCPKKIAVSASKKAINVELFTTIIYIHETAHYFHFHAREKFNKGDFSKMTPLFAESFAQLLTHRVCQQLNDKALLAIFMRITEEQPIEYKQYKLPYEYETSFPFEKQKKINFNYTLMKNFSVESIVKAFVMGELNTDCSDIIYSLQAIAIEKYLASHEPYMKTAYEYGLYNIPYEEDEKFID